MFYYDGTQGFRMRKYFFQRLWERLFWRGYHTRRGESLLQYQVDSNLAQTLYPLADHEPSSSDELRTDSLSKDAVSQRDSESLFLCWKSLSPREQEVTALLCLDYSTNQIANRLFVSPTTIKSHIRSILHKFDLHSREDLRVVLASWDFHEWA
jgi:DNA-binding CsgD family transcriptional regulator